MRKAPHTNLNILYYVQLITRKEQQAKQFVELHLEIQILSKACQTVECSKIFKMKFKCVVNVGEVFEWVLVYVHFLPV